MTYSPRDLLLARRAKRAGAKSSLRIVLEARRAKIPVSLGFALVEHESGFQNIFGHDAGSIRPNNGVVTQAAVQQLLRWVKNGHPSNGVGFTQLTYPGYLYQAERLGGAHIVRNQLRVGFGALASNVHKYGPRAALAIYNAGSAKSPAGQAYAEAVLRLQRKWHQVLA